MACRIPCAGRANESFRRGGVPAGFPFHADAKPRLAGFVGEAVVTHRRVTAWAWHVGDHPTSKNAAQQCVTHFGDRSQRSSLSLSSWAARSRRSSRFFRPARAAGPPAEEVL